MNLHGIVAGAVGAINPRVYASIQPSAGYATGPTGDRVPLYGPVQRVLVQLQALTEIDLRQLDQLNIGGSTHTLYMNGNLDALVRSTNKGGDLIRMDDGGLFLVTSVLEHWPDWTKAAVTLQLK